MVSRRDPPAARIVTLPGFARPAGGRLARERGKSYLVKTENVEELSTGNSCN